MQRRSAVKACLTCGAHELDVRQTAARGQQHQSSILVDEVLRQGERAGLDAIALAGAAAQAGQAEVVSAVACVDCMGHPQGRLNRARRNHIAGPARSDCLQSAAMADVHLLTRVVLVVNRGCTTVCWT